MFYKPRTMLNLLLLSICLLPPVTFAQTLNDNKILWSDYEILIPSAVVVLSAVSLVIFYFFCQRESSSDQRDDTETEQKFDKSDEIKELVENLDIEKGNGVSETSWNVHSVPLYVVSVKELNEVSMKDMKSESRTNSRT